MSLLNGYIPASELAPIPWNMSHLVRKSILSELVAMANAFKARFGDYPSITSAYRSYAEQQKLFDKYGYPKANYPGQSDHGWGIAIDFGSGVNIYGSMQWQWMNSVGRNYGFRPLNEKNLTFEPWHWAKTATVSGGVNLSLTAEEHNALADTRAIVGLLHSWMLDGNVTQFHTIRANQNKILTALSDITSKLQELGADIEGLDVELDDLATGGTVTLSVEDREHMVASILAGLPQTDAAAILDALYARLEN